jgi:hypothetical protein
VAPGGSHVGQRHGLIVKHQVGGRPRHAPSTAETRWMRDKDTARQTYKLSGVRNGEDLSTSRNSCSAR